MYRVYGAVSFGYHFPIALYCMDISSKFTLYVLQYIIYVRVRPLYYVCNFAKKRLSLWGVYSIDIYNIYTCTWENVSYFSVRTFKLDPDKFYPLYIV